MAFFPETPTWELDVYQLETPDPVLGGPPVYDINGVLRGGHSNATGQALVNRTAFLRDSIDVVNSNISDHEVAVNPHPQYVSAAAVPGLAPIQSVAVTAPLVKTGTSAVTLSMPLVTTSVDGYMSATDKLKLEGLVASSTAGAVTSVNGLTGVVTLTKSSISLGNIDNTSDVNKPISTATQTALALKLADAPIDGGLYLRQNGAWVAAAGQVLIQDLGAVGATNGQTLAMDIGAYKFFSASLSAASANTTWTLNLQFNNIPSSATSAVSWHVEIIAGSKRVVNYPSTVKWASGVKPTLTSGRCVIMFYQMLNRSSIYGMLVDEGNL